MSDCIDGPNYHQSTGPCEGDVSEYKALSGSGLTYPRCVKHYDAYAARVGPKLDEIRRNYPDTDQPPSWFDPSYAGERWNEDD